MSTFLHQLIAEAPMILVAVIFGTIGWRRLRDNHRSAAYWLVAGMTGLLLLSCWEAFRVVQLLELDVQHIRGQIGAQATAAHRTTTGAVSLVLMVFSISVVAMSAISSRMSPAPARN